jgi:hypothetical protein
MSVGFSKVLTHLHCLDFCRQIRRMEEVWSISHTFEQVLCIDLGTNRPLASRLCGNKSPWTHHFIQIEFLNPCLEIFKIVMLSTRKIFERSYHKQDTFSLNREND